MPYITLPVKPYIKHYLETTYGNPVILDDDMEFYDDIIRSLRSPCKRYERRNANFHLKRDYKCSIEILITDADFYRYGWMLSATDIIRINRKFEKKVKGIMMLKVGFMQNFKSIKDSICTFQEKDLFFEDVWKFESIKKEFYRKSKKLPEHHSFNCTDELQVHLINRMLKLIDILINNNMEKTTVMAQKITPYSNDQKNLFVVQLSSEKDICTV